ncbi:MAG TPA: class I SAM-dependent methyltransferase [Anaeromyxobacteraceae bacterium]|nr:class I SAM-dependent methyltransferase [Anaeromyxobacteraceae bacterium]
MAETIRALDIVVAKLAPRDFAVRLWEGTTVPPERGQARFTLVLNHPGALRRMLWPPGELTAAEAFIRGDYDVEGDLIAALARRDQLYIGAREAASLLRLAPSLLLAEGAHGSLERAATLHGEKHTRDRDTVAVRHHYDAGNDFYALWLDERMVYSCAFFPTSDATLDEAQEAKLELICRKLRLKPGDRLLDIGCGWGGLVIHAAERHGVSALGITLSPAQAELARERVAARGLSSRCRIEIADYRELRAEPFDAVASVGMIEHVGLSRLPVYFEQAFRLLRPGGLFLNHGIAPDVPRDDGLGSKLLRKGGFLQRYVFPDAELPFVHETAETALRTGFELRDVDALREHYALTLRHWVSRLERRRPEAIRSVGETAYRIWRLYMAGAAADFLRGQNGVYQALYVRPDHGRSGLPLSRAEWYSRPLVTAHPPAREAGAKQLRRTPPAGARRKARRPRRR